jgi:predicted alpha/beta hydrolase family esterase
MIVHGTYGSPFAHWLPSLSHWARDAGGTLYVPHLPSPAGQCFDTWATIVDSYRAAGLLGDEPAMIGMSSGAAFLTKYVLSRGLTGALLVTVSGFTNHVSGHQESDAANTTFYVEEATLGGVAARFARRVAFYATDDPYLPTAALARFATAIAAEHRVIAGAGHFNTQSGFDTFPDLEHLLDTVWPARR